MEAKYIVGELPAAMGTCYGGIIFPAFMDHSQVAKALRIEATGAGMCYFNGEKWVCHGKSQSLDLESHEDDEKQLNKLGKLY